MLNRVIEESLSRSPEYKQFLLEEQAAQDKKIAAIAESANAELRKTAKAYADLQNSFWSKPVAEIQKVMWSQNPTLISGVYWNVLFNAPVDEDAPLTITGTPAEAEATLKQFVDTLPSRKGFVLSPSALMKLVLFTQSQLLTGRNPVTPANLDVYLRTLVTHKCFDAATGECSYDASRIQRRPEPVDAVPTLDDIEMIDSSTEEGRRKERRLVEDLADEQSLPLTQAWFKSLRENFNGFQPSREDYAYIVDLFRRSNWSPLKEENYDAARRHLVKIGKWSTSMLTHDEIRSIAIERLNMRNVDVRSLVWNGTKQALLDHLQRERVSLLA